MDNRYATRLVLDFLRNGTLCLLPFMAANGLAVEVGSRYQSFCFQTSTAAQQACWASRDTINSDSGEQTLTCVATLGGYKLNCAGCIQGGADRIDGHFLAASAGSTFCETQFERENDNADAIVILNQDLGTAEGEIDALQAYTIANDSANTTQNSDIQTNKTNIQTNTSTIGLQQTAINANTTRRGQVDQILIEIDGELVDLSDTAALIASDVGINAQNIGINSGNVSGLSGALGVQTNNLNSLSATVATNQQLFNDYQTVQSASDAQTNSQLATVNSNLVGQTVTLNNSLNALLNEQAATTTSIANQTATLSQQLYNLELKGDTRSGQLSQLSTQTYNLELKGDINNARLLQIDANLDGSNLRLENINASIIADSNAQHSRIDSTNTKLDSLIALQGGTTVAVDTLNATTGLQANRLLDVNATIGIQANRQSETNALLTQIRDGQGSINISGTNISIDNSGVETRIDAQILQDSQIASLLNNSINSLLNEQALTSSRLADANTYASTVNPKLDALISNTNYTTGTLTPVQRAVRDSQKETYDALTQVPLVQAFNAIGTVWTGNTTTFACPTPSIDLTGTIIGTTVSFDMHCTLIGEYPDLLQLIAKLAWAFTAIMIFFRV